jgi:hypothetical protein
MKRSRSAKRGSISLRKRFGTSGKMILLFLGSLRMLPKRLMHLKEIYLNTLKVITRHKSICLTRKNWSNLRKWKRLKSHTITSLRSLIL